MSDSEPDVNEAEEDFTDMQTRQQSKDSFIEMV